MSSNGTPVAWAACAALILSAVGGLFFLQHSKNRFRTQFHASREVEAKLAVAEQELGRNGFEQARRLAGEAAAIPHATNREAVDAFVKRLETEEEKYREAESGRRQKAFEEFVRRKLHEPATRALYENYFSKLLQELERNSTTEQHEAEMAVVKELFASVGYARFLSQYEVLVRRVYNPTNYDESREAELSTLLETQKLDIVQAVLDSIVERIPKQ